MRILLFAHRLVPNKGLDLAVRALTQLPHSDHLVVVGGASHFGEECRALAAKLGVADRVYFAGPVQPHEIDEAILASDVFLLPARRDTFPLMVQHALACGRPVVVTDTCQSVELLRDAVAVARPTADSIAACIATISGYEEERLRRAGPDLIRREYAPSVVARMLEDVYVGVMNGSVPDGDTSRRQL